MPFSIYSSSSSPSSTSELFSDSGSDPVSSFPVSSFRPRNHNDKMAGENALNIRKLNAFETSVIFQKNKYWMM